MVSVDSQPFSSCATMSALITADCFWSAGYLATSRSILRRDSGAQHQRSMSPNTMSSVPMMATASASMWPLRQLAHRRQVRESRRTQFHAVGLVGTVGDEVDAEFALRMLHRGIRLAFGHVHALGEQLEVVDQFLHRALHPDARGRRHLVVVGDHRSRVAAQPVDALPDDAVRLPHFLDAHQVAVVGVAVHAHRDVEVDPVVDLVGLLLAQVPFDARAAQHHAGKAERQRALGRDHADANGALLPDAVLREQRLVVVHALGEAFGEVLDEIEQRSLAVGVHLGQLARVARECCASYCGMLSGRSR